jgi:8-oxo-dGTP pyrophosphatase MutT (NUDIX family)
MFIKIYFNEKPLFLCDTIDYSIEPYVHHDDAVFIDELDTHTVNAMIHEMELPKIHAGVFLHSDLEALKKAFFKKFSIVKAAGGFIQDEDNRVLLIFRRGQWDLPKGKLDKGETLEACAVRESREETGLKEIELVRPLLITWHTYHEGTKHILKESHWYTMKSSNKQMLVPQVEEDIQEIRWVAFAELKNYVNNTFPSIIDVLKTAGAV